MAKSFFALIQISFSQDNTTCHIILVKFVKKILPTTILLWFSWNLNMENLKQLSRYSPSRFFQIAFIWLQSPFKHEHNFLICADFFYFINVFKWLKMQTVKFMFSSFVLKQSAHWLQRTSKRKCNYSISIQFYENRLGQSLKNVVIYNISNFHKIWCKIVGSRIFF